MPFYGFNRDAEMVNEGPRKLFWLEGMMGGTKNEHDCVYDFSRVDNAGDLTKIDRRTLVIHGDDD